MYSQYFLIAVSDRKIKEFSLEMHIELVEPVKVLGGVNRGELWKLSKVKGTLFVL